MPILRNRLQEVRWPRAVAGIVLSCMAGLSVHVIMLQVAHVPYPTGYPITGWPILCGVTLSAFALLWFCQLTADRLATLSFPTRVLLIALLASMLREAMRVTILDGVVTTAWRYSFVSDLPRFLVPFFLACLAVAAAPHLRGPAARLVGALSIGVITTYVFVPVLSSLLGHILQTIRYLSHDEIYRVPYGWHVEVPAYITFLEPTIAAFLLAALVLDRLSSSLSVSTLQFAFLVMAINTSLVRPLLYLPFSPFPVSLALLSMSQFFFEWLVLSVCIALTWRVACSTTALLPDRLYSRR